MQSSLPESDSSQVAFEQVYRAHFRLVWRILRSLGVREVDLLDVTHDVFLVVHRQLPTFEGRAQVSTWLFSICRWVASGYRRSSPIRREVVVDVRHLARTLSPTHDALERLDARELSRLLEAILSRMSEKRRITFVMYELEEMSGEEIAEVLAIPVGTVRSRLNAARGEFQAEVKALRKAHADGRALRQENS
ncbi:MAG TPA: sigma-70 family RNA polymerase sigma factor [Polyangiaceae bacterium]